MAETAPGRRPPFLPLGGVRVLDFGRVIAAPRCARYLAELGADVIHIERPGSGDDTRADPHVFDNELSGAFLLENWGKRSLAIDLSHPDAREIVEPLVRGADVVIENFRPGVMDRLGLGYAALSTLNPSLVMCSISAFGQSGPHADRAGYGFIADAVAGFPELTGEPDGPPVPSPIPIADVMAAGLAFGLISAALVERGRTERGAHIDLALLDAAFAAHDLALQMHLSSGGAVQKTRQGRYDPDRVPWGYFEGRDGWVCIMCGTDRQWAALAGLMGFDAARFATLRERRAALDTVYAAVESWVEGFVSVDEIVALLGAAGVPSSRLNTLSQAVADPQVKSRNLVETVTHPDLGPVQIQNLLGPSADPAARRPAPRLGQHSLEIAAEIGLAPERIEALLAAGCLFAPARPERRAS